MSNYSIIGWLTSLKHESDNYPKIVGPGEGLLTFDKNFSNIGCAEVKVYAPMSSTVWEITLGTPGDQPLIGTSNCSVKEQQSGSTYL